MSDWVQNLDFSILYWVHEHWQHPLLDRLMAFLTWIGNGGTVWILVGLGLLVFKQYRGSGLKIFLALLISLVLINWGLKELVGRLRPFRSTPASNSLSRNPRNTPFLQATRFLQRRRPPYS